MIHINKGRGAGEWITEEEFQKRFPLLCAILNTPRPFNEDGNRLKKFRVNRGLTIREMSLRTGIGVVDLCRIESGVVEVTKEIVDKYALAGDQ